MTIKAHNMTTTLNPDSTVTFSMTDAAGRALVERTLPINAVRDMLVIILMHTEDDLFEDDDLDDETEVAGHC